MAVTVDANMCLTLAGPRRLHVRAGSLGADNMTNAAACCRSELRAEPCATPCCAMLKLTTHHGRVTAPLLAALSTSNTLRAEREPRSSSTGYSGSSHAAPPRPSRAAAAAAAAAGAGAPAAPRLASTRRAMPAACASPSARWSATPLVAQCSSAPPSSSALTSSPVAAWRASGRLSSVCAPSGCSILQYSALRLLTRRRCFIRKRSANFAPRLCSSARRRATRPCRRPPTSG